MELVANYLIAGGCEEILNECREELRRFEAGYAWLKRQEYIVEGIEGTEEWLGDEDVEI
jgi:hypothetical protein